MIKKGLMNLKFIVAGIGIFVILSCTVILMMVCRSASEGNGLVKGETDQASSVENKREPIRVKVRIGNSALVFGNELTISLNQTHYEGSPARCKVFAKVVSPGFQEMGIPGAEIGYIATYTGKINYDIQLLAANATMAEFLISPKGK